MTVTRDAVALLIFERWHAAHEGYDLAELAGVLDSNVTVHSLFRPVPAQGRDAAVRHFEGTMAVFPDLSMPLVSTPAVAADGAVLAEVMFTGTFTGTLTWREIAYKGAGEPFEVPGVVVLHTSGDTVTSVRTLFDRELWLRQIGVAETAGT